MFLGYLYSSDTDKVLMAMKCFGLLYQECNLLTGDRESPIHPSPFSTVYYKLAEEVSQRGLSIKRIHFVYFFCNIVLESVSFLPYFSFLYFSFKKLLHVYNLWNIRLFLNIMCSCHNKLFKTIDCNCY